MEKKSLSIRFSTALALLMFSIVLEYMLSISLKLEGGTEFKKAASLPMIGLIQLFIIGGLFLKENWTRVLFLICFTFFSVPWIPVKIYALFKLGAFLSGNPILLMNQGLDLMQSFLLTGIAVALFFPAVRDAYTVSKPHYGQRVLLSVACFLTLGVGLGITKGMGFLGSLFNFQMKTDPQSNRANISLFSDKGQNLFKKLLKTEIKKTEAIIGLTLPDWGLPSSIEQSPLGHAVPFLDITNMHTAILFKPVAGSNGDVISLYQSFKNQESKRTRTPKEKPKWDLTISMKGKKDLNLPSGIQAYNEIEMKGSKANSMPQTGVSGDVRLHGERYLFVVFAPILDEAVAVDFINQLNSSSKITKKPIPSPPVAASNVTMTSKKSEVRKSGTVTKKKPIEVKREKTKTSATVRERINYNGRPVRVRFTGKSRSSIAGHIYINIDDQMAADKEIRIFSNKSWALNLPSQPGFFNIKKASGRIDSKGRLRGLPKNAFKGANRVWKTGSIDVTVGKVRI